MTSNPPAFEWIDGDPLMEAIAATIWDHCRTEGTSLIVDDPRNIAAVAAAVTRAAVPAVFPEPPSRAAVLLEAADFVRGLLLTRTSITTAGLEAELRRMAVEADESRVSEAWLAVFPEPPAAEAEPICKFEQGCHRVVACDPGCGAAPAVFPEPPSRAASLSVAERQFLTFALDLAADEMASRGDEFGAEDQAALESLRRLAAEAQQQEITPCGPVPSRCDAEAGEPCADHEREQAHAEGEHCFCGPECEVGARPQPDTEAPLSALQAREKTIRDHTLALHQVGEQLSQIESWFWEHLADVREAARQELDGPLPDDVVQQAAAADSEETQS